MTDTLLIMSTFPNMEKAEELATRLIQAKLAACINILPPMKSVYRWKNRIESGTEHLLMIKTRKERYQAVTEVIQQQHPYELPEIIAVPINAGLPAYLDWILENTTE